MKHSIIYVSTANHLMMESELLNILEQSRSWNEVHGITGMLIYIQGLFLNNEFPGCSAQVTGRFMQVLEGSKEEIDSIFTRIQADPRHHSIIVLHDSPLEFRNFESWHMGFSSITTDEFRADPGYFALDKSFVANAETTTVNLPLIFLKSFYQRSLSQTTLFSTHLINSK